MWVAAYLVRNIKEISFFFWSGKWEHMDEPAKNHLLFWKLPVLKIQDQPCLKTNIKITISDQQKSPLNFVIRHFL